MLPESRERGYKPGRFSFNVKGGRCEACQGDGLKRIEMNFLPDVYVTCDVCRGRRYNHETLQVKYTELLHRRSAGSAGGGGAGLLENIPQIKVKLETLVRVGLGYLHLGQSSTTLSGGEAQRIKLARELSRRQTGKTLYILDEPTTGLHFEDVAQAAGCAAQPGGSGQYCGGDRTSTGRDQDRGLDHRPGSGGRRSRRHAGRLRHAGGDSAQSEELHRAGARQGASRKDEPHEPVFRTSRSPSKA